MHMTDNPVRDAYRHDMELEDGHRYCYGCGDRLYPGDMAYRIEGELYCEECIEASREEVGDED